MRTSPLLADFIHARGCKPICAKLLTLPSSEMPVSIFCMAASHKMSDSYYTAKQLALRAVCTENFLQKFYEVCCKTGLIFCGKLHLTKRTVPSSYLLWAGQWKVLRSATGIPASSDFASRHSCGAIENLRHFPFAYTAEQSHPPPTAGP